MAVYLKFSFLKRNDKMSEMEKYHEALVGSPAYINSEIAIVEEGPSEFTLCIGNSNEHDIHGEIYK